MDSIVQAILNLSQLDVSYIKITDATEDSFVMSIDSKTTKTGPLGATMSPMTVDMIGPKGPFAKLDLPEVKTSSKGAVVKITNQLIKIENMEAYLAFNKSLQWDDKLTMYLDNGKGTIKALGMKSNIVYKKPVAMLGMNGPQTEILKTEILADGSFKNTMKTTNPSPVETEMGKVNFAFKNGAGETLAVQSASLHMLCGETIYEAVGQVKAKGDVSNVQLVGLGDEKGTWIKNTILFFNVSVTLTPELTELLKA